MKQTGSSHLSPSRTPTEFATLVVDDDPLQSGYVAALLNHSGRPVREAHDGVAALTVIKDSDVSIVICDIDMPGMNGIELVRRIRALELGRYIYILLVTARQEPSDFSDGLLAGADDFMTKPILPELLFVRVIAAERMLRYQTEVWAKSASLEKANAQLEADLAEAGRMQQSIVPQSGAKFSYASLWPLYLPTQHVSGDMLNFFDVEGGEIGFYAVDVAGHGVRAALKAATIGHIVDRQYFDRATSVSRQERSAARLILDLNSQFQTGIESEGYFTMVCGLINSRTQQLTLALAGHPPPVLLRLGEWRFIGEGSLPVGLFDDPGTVEVAAAIQPGDRLIVYSDGIIEAKNRVGEEFGVERLVQAAEKGVGAEAIVSVVTEELRRWSGRSQLADDASMLVIEILERSND